MMGPISNLKYCQILHILNQDRDYGNIKYIVLDP